MIEIRNATIEDLKEISIIENKCFTKDLAESDYSIASRLNKQSDTYYVAISNKQVVGVLNGVISKDCILEDEMFEDIKKNEVGDYFIILGLSIHPEYQNKGIAKEMIEYIVNVNSNKKAIILTTQEELINYYEKNNFINKGISPSHHGNKTWYKMIRYIKRQDV